MSAERLISALLVFLAVCSSCVRSGGNSTVQAKMESAPGMKVLLEEIDVKSVVLFDSLVSNEHGYFTFNLKLKETGFFRITFPGGKYLLLVIKPGDQIVLSADTSTLPANVTLHGSEESALLQDFLAVSGINKRKADSITQLLANHTDSADFAWLTESSIPVFENILNSQDSTERVFISRHPSLLATLIVLNYAFGPKPVLTMEENLPLYLRVDSALAVTYPENKHVIYHHKRILAFQTR